MRWFRAILVGVIAAEAVLFAAVGPRWRATAPDVCPLAFSPDGATFTTDGPSDDGKPSLMAWDTATGWPRRVALPPMPAHRQGYCFAAGGRGQAWPVWYALPAADRDTPGDAVTIRPVRDPATAAVVGYAVDGLPLESLRDVSPDGGWATVAVGPGRESVELRAMADGRPAYAALPRPGEDWSGVCYSADGTRATIRWETKPANEQPPRQFDEEIALPAGRLLRRVEVAGDDHPEPDVVPISATPGRVVEVYHRAAEPPLVEAVKEWVVQQVRRPAFVFHEGPVPTEAVFVTRDAAGGRPRAVVVTPRNSLTVLAPTGRWIAAYDERRLSMWDTDPPPAWPWAVTAGILTTAAWATLERRRSRRAAR